MARDRTGDRGSVEDTNTGHFDVVVVGGGAAGVAAAIGAAKNGASTLLVEAGSLIGGGLTSGLPIMGCCNALGEWIVGGIARELIDTLSSIDGFVGRVFDWRLIWSVCVDPEMLKLVIIEALERYGVRWLVGTLAVDVAAQDGRVQNVELISKSGRSRVPADVIVDCSGDGDIATSAGAAFEKGSPEGEFQPVSLILRVCNVDFDRFLVYVRDNPEDFILGEHPLIDKSPAECAAEVYRAGIPYAALDARGPLWQQALQFGEMFPSTAIYMSPTSWRKREMTLNCTRVANVDATDSRAVSRALGALSRQAGIALGFVRGSLPGFEEASLSAVSPWIGVRETRRIVGETVLTEGDVLGGRKSDDGVAKGGHHVDIHGDGTYQKRTPVSGGRSYDIPYGCLIPKALTNVLVAGRCISSTREANGSVRVMGQCLATGEAAGTAAALCVAEGWSDVRSVSTALLRERLKSQGAVVDGTS